MKHRADELLVAQGLAPNRSRARALIMAGHVCIGDRVVDKAGTMLDDSVQIEIKAGPQFVSRGGTKLAHALDVFGVDPAGYVCSDFGASTGGFTDVLLQRGAVRIYAIDVGYGQLDYRLRTDPRVVVMERTNVRSLDDLPEPVDLVTVDVSFISLKLVFPSIKRVLKPAAGIAIALVKPQFEAGRQQVGKGGVVRDKRIHAQVLRDTAAAAEETGLHVSGITSSPITGPAGNREFLMLLAQGRDLEFSLDSAIARAFDEPVE